MWLQSLGKTQKPNPFFNIISFILKLNLFEGPEHGLRGIPRHDVLFPAYAASLDAVHFPLDQRTPLDLHAHQATAQPDRVHVLAQAAQNCI